MKNKVFSLMAVVMFVGSSMHLNANDNKTINEDLAFETCFDIAAEAEDQFMHAMLNKMGVLPTSLSGYNVFAAAYDECSAYGG